MSRDQAPELDAQKWTAVARLLRPQGRRGELLAELLTDFVESFNHRKRLFLIPENSAAAVEPRELNIEHFWPHKGRIVLKFAGIDSISAAESLGRGLLAVPRSERMPLQFGEAYAGDMIGMSLLHVAQDGTKTLGSITDILPGDAGADLLQLGEGDHAILIPFARAYLKKINFDERTIEMELPPGLIEIQRQKS